MRTKQSLPKSISISEPVRKSTQPKQQVERTKALAKAKCHPILKFSCPGHPAPSGLRFEDAIPGIKFALGENVKQSNWGDKFTTRYPQTRMGVEQLIRDRFKAAQDYERKWTQYRGLKNKQGVIPPRRDLELDALVEILHGKRLVHSHSYRQDEILMLLRIAEDFGFSSNTSWKGTKWRKHSPVTVPALQPSVIGGRTNSRSTMPFHTMAP